ASFNFTMPPLSAPGKSQNPISLMLFEVDDPPEHRSPNRLGFAVVDPPSVNSMSGAVVLESVEYQLSSASTIFARRSACEYPDAGIESAMFILYDAVARFHFVADLASKVVSVLAP